MNDCWILKINASQHEQDNKEFSFIGGYPKLPIDMEFPTCSLCSEQQSFMLQIAFPDRHEWSGLSLAIFSCTSCADENHLIPEMLQSPLLDADIPKQFIEDYQKNFKFIVFNTNQGVLRKEYIQKVIYKPLSLLSSNTTDSNQIGGIPSWILEDESPKKYNNSSEMFFLMQIEQDYEFEIYENAPHQIELDLSGNPSPSENLFYQLFNGNFIYFFGVKNPSIPLVYVITQT